MWGKPQLGVPHQQLRALRSSKTVLYWRSVHERRPDGQEPHRALPADLQAECERALEHGTPLRLCEALFPHTVGFLHLDFEVYLEQAPTQAEQDAYLAGCLDAIRRRFSADHSFVLEDCVYASGRCRPVEKNGVTAFKARSMHRDGAACLHYVGLLHCVQLCGCMCARMASGRGVPHLPTYLLPYF